MKEFISTKERFELEMILANYTAMFNSKQLSPLAYEDLQKTNSSFPHIDDEKFWEKLNSVLVENYDLDLQTLEELICDGVKGEPFKRTRIFEFIKQKNI